jgi:hypothetical protein
VTAIALRAVGFIVVLVIGGALVMYLFTQDRRWLRFGWQVLKYSLVVVALALAFLVLERLVIAI